MRIFKRRNPKTKAERLYYAYRRQMFAAAYEILGDSTLAEEAIQNSFEKIIKSRCKINEKDEKRVRALLRLVCRNAAVDILRKNKRVYELREDFPDEESGDIADIIVSKENLTELLDCIDSLRPVYRDVMLLKFYHGYENREIAKMLGITEDAVRKRIERGRRELKALLEKEAEKNEI